MLRVVLPSFVALAVLLPALTPAVAQEALPEGCTQESPRVVVCAWSAEFSAGSAESFSFALPKLGLTTTEIVLESTLGTHYFWQVRNESGGGIAGRGVFPLFTPASDADRVERAQALIDFDPSASYELVVATPAFVVQQPGRVEALLTLEDAQGSVAASSRAGGPDDPHVTDRIGDQRPEGPEAFDIAGGWMDDPFLDDGVIEVGVVLPGLADFPRAAPPPARAIRAFVDPEPVLLFRFELLGAHSEVDWHRDDTGAWSAHIHYQFTHEDGGAPTAAGAGGPFANLPVRVDEANGTLVSPIPLKFLGYPGESASFDGMHIEVALQDDNGVDPARQPPFDVAEENVRAFAVGGPEVWDRLRAEAQGSVAVVPAAPSEAPWYRAPLAPENVLDTLQAAAFAGALVTGTAGYVLVRRRRERLDRLLREIDAVVERARDDAAALAALGDLERQYDAMLLSGKLDEKNHDVVVRRIERHGYRIAREPRGQGPPAADGRAQP